MRAAIATAKRETLLKEIHDTFLQWPKLERKIFTQVHYNGQSPEAISRSLQLDVEEVNAILKQCERRLYDSLRNFRKNSCAEHALMPDGIACPAA